MKLILLLRLALPVIALNPTTADAQAFRVPRVEVGGEGGLLIAIGEGVHLQPMVGPRLTFNISQRDAVELAADTFLPNDFGGIYGLYFLHYRRMTRPPSNLRGIRPFYTVGTGGYYRHEKVPERRVPRADGSVVVYPASSHGELTRLNLATVGGGFELALNRHASFRLDGSGFLAVHNEGYIAFRILAGVSVPVGGYRASSIK